MDWGEPNKLDHARRVAASLGYIGLSRYNRVSLYALGESVAEHLPNLRGRRPIPQMLDFLKSLKPRPAGNLASAMKRLSLVQRVPGVVVLISDFLDKGDVEAAIKFLGAQRYDGYAIQLLAPQEVDPTKGEIVGDLKLTDIEDDDVAEVSVTPALLRRYKANLHAWCEHVRSQCVKRGVAYLFAETSVPFEDLVLKYLRQRGVLG
jgi:uncharacterized protein (DUF58 family)